MSHDSYLRRIARRAAAPVDLLRTLPGEQIALRGLLLVSGAAALTLAPGGRLVLAAALVLIGTPALVGAVAEPDGPGPALVLGTAVAAWVIRYGVAAPPLEITLALAVALALHHATAALCAAMVPTSRVEPVVVRRWAGRVAAGLVPAAGAAVAIRWLGRPAASVPLEFAGIAAVVVLVAAPVALSRLGRPR
jgi:hypothetical protein